MEPKIFLYDIETAPLKAYTWSLWDEVRSTEKVVEDWQILTWAGKWLGERDVYFDANIYHGDGTSDTETVTTLHQCIDEADIVVAHNGNKFDIKRMNARFLAAGLGPPSPYRKIDTLVEARKNFAMTSNRLDDLGDFLGVGRKKSTGGFKLWVECLEGNPKSFEKMIKYNQQDVRLLEKVYLKLRPWMNNHPNLGVFNEDGRDTCPKCGSHNIQWRGYAVTQAARYRRFQCNSCGGWGRSRMLDKDLDRAGVMTNVN